MALHVHRSNETSQFQKDKERSSRRFKTNLEAIIAKYDHSFIDSDVLDLKDMAIVEDRGFIGGMKTQKIGKVRLAADKDCPHSCPGTQWNSTKDSTDSAFGSTRYSESEDTSGTETIANYSFQGTRSAGKNNAKKIDFRLEDIWMRSGFHSEDSGNEDVESDHSGPICTPSKSSLRSLSCHQRKQEAVRDPMSLSTRQNPWGNLSRRCDAEEEAELKGQMSRVLPPDDEEEEESGSEDEEEEDNDPYEFKDEELPSILEEKNRFLSKFLVGSFIDGNDIDETESQTDDDEASTGTVESSEATSGAISTWSSLAPKTPPRRSSKPLRRCGDMNLDDATFEIPASDSKEISPDWKPCEKRRDATFEIPASDSKEISPDWKPCEKRGLSSTESDFTECSTILAGNLHSERDVFRPSQLLLRANKNKSCVRNEPSQPPFQAICNSTMLSEINSSEEAVPKERTFQRSGDLELPLDGKEGEVLDDQVNKTPKRGKPIHSARVPTDTREVVREDESTSNGDLGRTLFRTPSMRNRNEDGVMTPGYQDTSGITPRAKLRKGPARQSPIGLSSPRFDTREIVKMFQSPKLFEDLDLEDLDLTPRRRVKPEGAPTSSRSLRDALWYLHSPKARIRTNMNCQLGSQTAKEIRPGGHGLTDETVLKYQSFDATDFTLERRNDDSVVKRAVNLDNTLSVARGKSSVDIDNNKSFEGVNMISPEVRSERRCTTHLKGDSPIKSGQDKSISPSEKPVQSIQTLTHADSAVGQKSKSKTVKPDDQRHTFKSDRTYIVASLPESRGTRAYPKSKQREFQDSTKKQSSGARLQDPLEMHRSSRSARDSDSQALPSSRHSAPRRNKPTVEKPVQLAKLARNPSREDTIQGSQKKTPPMSRRVKNGSVTPTPDTPSTLSSPFNHMSLSTPHKFYSQKKETLSEDFMTRLSDQKKDRIRAVKQAKPKPLAEKLRSKGKESDQAKLDATHMTIRHGDDDSEEEMDVDPYSLTADDSSPRPRLYNQRPQLDPEKRPNSKFVSRGAKNPDMATCNSESEKLRYLLFKKNRQSTRSKDLICRDFTKSGLKNIRESKFSTVNNEEVSLTGSSRTSHNPRDSEIPFDSRGSDASARNVKGPSISKKKQNKASTIHRSNPSSPPPSPIYQSEDFPRPSRDDQRKKASKSSSKMAARREHSQYFSDEECNSSGDSAKFISSKTNQSECRTTTDPGKQSDACASPKHRKLCHTEEGARPKVTTTMKCGQIITTPTKDLHKTCSPLHKVRMGKTRKLYPTSPVQTYRKTEVQTDRSSSTNSSKSNHGRTQNLKTTPRRLIASPSNHHGNVGPMETSRLDMSSPLKAGGCNVSSSYVCHGPGHCRKPFCFNCALSDAAICTICQSDNPAQCRKIIRSEISRSNFLSLWPSNAAESISVIVQCGLALIV